MAANPPHFDIDHPAGANFKGFPRVFHGKNGFIQADRGVDLRLYPGMIDQIVIGEGLLDIIQFEAIQFLKGGQIFEGIAGIGIHR